MLKGRESQPLTKEKKKLLILPLKRSNSSNTVKREDFRKFYLKGFAVFGKNAPIHQMTPLKNSILTPLINTFNLQEKNPTKTNKTPN